MEKLHKLLGTTPGKGVQPGEMLSYSVAGLGQNLISGLVGSYLMFFYSNALRIEAWHVGVLMLVCRIFDAMNDPIMGSIVDKTRTKMGKCRPYLLYTPIPIALLTILLFVAGPSWAYGARLAFAALSYIIWSVAYTIVDVPYWGLATGMSKDTNVRGTMLTIARLFCTAGAGIISLICPLVIGGIQNKYTHPGGTLVDGVDVGGQLINDSAALEFSNALSPAFIIMAVIIAIISVPTFLIGFKFSKERYYNPNEKPATLKHNISLLFKNKPLMLIVLSGILGAGKVMFIYSGIYFATYNCVAILGADSIFGMKGAALNTIITFAVVPGGLIASLLVPWCTKKFGKKNTYIWTHIIGGLIMMLSYFVGWDAKWKIIVMFIALVVGGIPAGFYNILTYSLIGDTVDYLEDKTAERGEGICFAMQTFINKVGMAFGAFLPLILLSIGNIVPTNPSTFSKENMGGLNLIYMATILIPGISTVLTAIPMFFYKFTEKEQGEAVKRVEERIGGLNIDNAMSDASIAE